MRESKKKGGQVNNGACYGREKNFKRVGELVVSENSNCSRSRSKLGLCLPTSFDFD